MLPSTAPNYPGSAIRASIFFPKRRSPRPKQTDHLRQRLRPARAIRSTAFSPPRRIIRGAQIPIAPAAPPHVPLSRFLSLEAFGRRPSRCAAPPSMAGIRNPSQDRRIGCARDMSAYAAEATQSRTGPADETCTEAETPWATRQSRGRSSGHKVCNPRDRPRQHDQAEWRSSSSILKFESYQAALSRL
jgi:hypothetical protein